MSLFAACSNQEKGQSNEKPNDIREAVWEQLSEREKEWIVGTWEDGEATEVTVNRDMLSPPHNIHYEGKEVYVVNFPIKANHILNIILLFLLTLILLNLLKSVHI